MKLLKIIINKKQELMETLEKEIKKLNITEGAIVSIIGAVDECRISNMPKEDAMKDIVSEYNQPLELSGMGDIKDGKPHIHCVLSKENGEAIAGHLHWAKVKSWPVTVYVLAGGIK